MKPCVLLCSPSKTYSSPYQGMYVGQFWITYNQHACVALLRFCQNARQRRASCPKRPWGKNKELDGNAVLYLFFFSFSLNQWEEHHETPQTTFFRIEYQAWRNLNWVGNGVLFCRSPALTKKLPRLFTGNRKENRRMLRGYDLKEQVNIQLHSQSISISIPSETHSWCLSRMSPFTLPPTPKNTHQHAHLPAHR